MRHKMGTKTQDCHLHKLGTPNWTVFRTHHPKTAKEPHKHEIGQMNQCNESNDSQKHETSYKNQYDNRLASSVTQTFKQTTTYELSQSELKGYITSMLESAKSPATFQWLTRSRTTVRNRHSNCFPNFFDGKLVKSQVFLFIW